jgi:2-hydroxy-3-oxopropionate reductase
MMIARDFKPGGTIAINLKDIRNVMDTAVENDIPLPMTSILLTIFQSMKNSGHNSEDHSGIIQYYD